MFFLFIFIFIFIFRLMFTCIVIFICIFIFIWLRGLICHTFVGAAARAFPDPAPTQKGHPT